jgi:hypothetical protein
MRKPDFSGEWILDKEASRLSAGANTVQSARWVIEHREPVFRHKGSFVFETGTRDYEYELQTGAPALQWHGDALVVTFREPLPDGLAGTMTVSFRYELIDDGSRIRASEQVRGTSWDQDNVWIFERR